jgi:hypothetical protein
MVVLALLGMDGMAAYRLIKVQSSWPAQMRLISTTAMIGIGIEEVDPITTLIMTVPFRL